ncbi:MAG: DUF1329 domain-containing protein [Oleiphilaceae bacterium]|nr:DUF1329 domain-containing protein [Oleiphilaceae bacterium]
MPARKLFCHIAAVTSLSLIAATAFAEVSPEEAEKLGNELTAMGAEKSGNGDEIPAYEGGLREAPEGYEGNHRYVNPFPEDEELFRIDQGNVDEYADRLSPGQVAMIKKYDYFFIPVYPTRRTAAYPREWEEQTRSNATQVELEPSGNGLINYETGTPFPLPQSGVEAVFNHTTRYRGGSVTRHIAQASPQPDGEFSAVKLSEDITYPPYLTDYREGEHDNILFYFRTTITEPSRLSGDVLLVHETLNQVKKERSVWVYNNAQRRVRRAPNVAYDGTPSGTESQRTADNLDMYNGAPDRYNWELMGKKEMYIPYNSYRLASGELEYDDIIQAGHIDPSLTRYELHRVWHVRATLKDDARHVYHQRDLYIDEDSWQIAVVDHFDERGDLWRVAEAHMLQAYDVQVPFYALETLYDLLSGRYIVTGMTNQENPPFEFGTERRSSYYTPAALRRSGR